METVYNFSYTYGYYWGVGVFCTRGPILKGYYGYCYYSYYGGIGVVLWSVPGRSTFVGTSIGRFFGSKVDFFGPSSLIGSFTIAEGMEMFFY